MNKAMVGGEGKIPSEDAILACLAEYFPNRHPRLSLCRGDDCAIFKAGGEICASVDMFIEDAHFRRSYFLPDEIGHKALAVNISDIAACGGRPAAFTLTLGLPGWIDMPWLSEFFAGMSALANRHNMVLAGGDLSRADRLCVSIGVFGEPQDGCGFLLRGGSMPGDTLFVVGDIGLARTGLLELEASGREALEKWPKACMAHLKPEPQVGAGLMLARAGANARPPALMDLSDGVARDLPRLLGASGELGANAVHLGVDFTLGREILREETLKRAEMNGEDPALAALIGGEDYALLGACAPDMTMALRAAIPDFHEIGVINDSGRFTLRGRDLSGLRGFDHFETA